ncbi:hypothetical protein PCASD_25165 [Puccinia coronata f. sp. avenae]|uniref:Uncharacterized protein n=1 Tax=Puccinia coronata f. sp. avenae TaxID=200324 RepID=A0A2N5THK3_9BASI|nr:hypothetical protein PCASD_25165 [Puccinia coronata f. sp. avenae]
MGLSPPAEFLTLLASPSLWEGGFAAPPPAVGLVLAQPLLLNPSSQPPSSTTPTNPGTTSSGTAPTTPATTTHHCSLHRAAPTTPPSLTTAPPLLAPPATVPRDGRGEPSYRTPRTPWFCRRGAWGAGYRTRVKHPGIPGMKSKHETTAVSRNQGS